MQINQRAELVGVELRHVHVHVFVLHKEVVGLSPHVLAFNDGWAVQCDADF